MTEERGFKVYAKINENGEIIAINSEVFIKDLTGWVFIDEGFGDKYVHAQGNYMGENLNDEEGNYKFILINGKIERKCTIN